MNTRASARIFFLTLLLFLGLDIGPKLCAVRISEDGLVLTRSDAAGVVVGGLVGGGTYFALNHFENDIFSTTQIDNKNVRLYKILLSVGAGCLVGLTTDLILSYIGAKKREDLESYLKMLDQAAEVSQSELIKAPTEKLNKFLQKYYGKKLYFDQAIKDFSDLNKILKEVRIGLRRVIGRIELLKSENDRALYAGCKKLLQEMDCCAQELRERERIVAVEYKYVKTMGKLWKTKEQIESILDGEEVSSVKDSYEKIVTYGIAIIDEYWPLVQLVRRLRYTIVTVNKLITRCTKQWRFCGDKSGVDERYAVFVEGYALLIERVKTEFPFDAYQERIQQIFSSDIYHEEVKLLESDKQHKELVAALTTIRDDLRGLVKNIKDEISNTNDGIKEILNHAKAIKSRTSVVESNLSSVRKDLSKVKDDMKDVKNDVSAVRRDVSVLSSQKR